MARGWALAVWGLPVLFGRFLHGVVPGFEEVALSPVQKPVAADSGRSPLS